MKKCENCNPFENYDALVILTRQGCVMTSDDAQLTFDEDAQLYKLNKSIADRTRKIHFEYERITSVVSILQQFISEGCVDVTGLPKNVMNYSLYEIETRLQDITEDLSKTAICQSNFKFPVVNCHFCHLSSPNSHLLNSQLHITSHFLNCQQQFHIF